MTQISLMGPGWVVQIAKNPNPIPSIVGMEKLSELPTVGGAMQFLDQFWDYWLFETEEAARAAHPEFPEGVYWIEPTA